MSTEYRIANGLAKPRDVWPDSILGMRPVIRWIDPDGFSIAYVVMKSEGTFRIVTEYYRDEWEHGEWEPHPYHSPSGAFWEASSDHSGIYGSLDTAVGEMNMNVPWTRHVRKEVKEEKLHPSKRCRITTTRGSKS